MPCRSCVNGPQTWLMDYDDRGNTVLLGTCQHPTCIQQNNKVKSGERKKIDVFLWLDPVKNLITHGYSRRPLRECVGYRQRDATQQSLCIQCQHGPSREDQLLRKLNRCRAPLPAWITQNPIYSVDEIGVQHLAEAVLDDWHVSDILSDTPEKVILKCAMFQPRDKDIDRHTPSVPDFLDILKGDVSPIQEGSDTVDQENATRSRIDNMSRSERVEFATELQELKPDCRLCEHSQHPWTFSWKNSGYHSSCHHPEIISTHRDTLVDGGFALKTVHNPECAGEVVDQHGQPIHCSYFSLKEELLMK